MKIFIAALLAMLLFEARGQDGCALAPPDRLDVANYPDIYEGDFVTFKAVGGSADSSSWYALYRDDCCIERLDSNRTGTFVRQLWSSDVFYVRIESFCDTTFAPQVDLDVYPRATSVREAGFENGEYAAVGAYDLLGQPVSPGQARGLFVVVLRNRAGREFRKLSWK